MVMSFFASSSFQAIAFAVVFYIGKKYLYILFLIFFSTSPVPSLEAFDDNDFFIKGCFSDFRNNVFNSFFSLKQGIITDIEGLIAIII